MFVPMVWQSDNVDHRLYVASIVRKAILVNAFNSENGQLIRRMVAFVNSFSEF
jgi:hypothetical protein